MDAKKLRELGIIEMKHQEAEEKLEAMEKVQLSKFVEVVFNDFNRFFIENEYDVETTEKTSVAKIGTVKITLKEQVEAGMYAYLGVMYKMELILSKTKRINLEIWINPKKDAFPKSSQYEAGNIKSIQKSLMAIEKVLEQGVALKFDIEVVENLGNGDIERSEKKYKNIVDVLKTYIARLE